MREHLMRDRLMVALDVPNADAALLIRKKIGSEAGWLKVGLDFLLQRVLH